MFKQMSLLLDYKNVIDSSLSVLNNEIQELRKVQQLNTYRQQEGVADILNSMFYPSINQVNQGLNQQSNYQEPNTSNYQEPNTSNYQEPHTSNYQKESYTIPPLQKHPERNVSTLPESIDLQKGSLDIQGSTDEPSKHNGIPESIDNETNFKSVKKMIQDINGKSSIIFSELGSL
jgi:hypothetical protein